MLIAFMGDPHVQKSNLAESERLLAWFTELANSRGAIRFISGDLYNDFALARVECIEFWDEWARGAILIDGNHDMNSDGSASALTAHVGKAEYVFQNASAAVFRTNPSYNTVCFDGKLFGFMPFIRNNEEFTKLALAMYECGVRTIFCHGEFDGAKYENGFYAPHGVDLKAFPSDLYFISGHIHAQQEFGNVWYPGTPRHLTRSDAGETKGVWFYETKTGHREFVPTPAEVAEPFQEFTLTPESTLKPEQIPASDRVFVDVRGPQEFVKATIKQLSPNVRVRSFPDQKKPAVDIKESEGIPVAFVKYASKYFTDNEVSLEVAKMVIEKVYTKCPSLRTGV